MRSPRCVFNTAIALHRVFIAPIEQSQLHLVRCPPTALFRTLILSTQRRTHIVVARPANTDPKKSRLPRDEEITSWSVLVVGADQKLSEPRPTSEVLASFDHKTHSLVVVVPGEPDVPPICKIVDKKAAWTAAKAKKRQQSSGGAAPSKTLELNWAIEQGDLQHRLQRMRDFLEKGFKLEIVLAPKRKGRQATLEEAKGLLSKIREVVSEVGARESKPMEGKMMGVLTLYTEGKTKKKRDIVV